VVTIQRMVLASQRVVAAIRSIRPAGRRWLPLFIWMAAIYVASDQPAQTIPDFGALDILLKKGSHFLAYGLMATLGMRATADFRRPLLWAIAITAVYAIFDEWHQTFVPGRNGRLVDVIIDCSGGLTAMIMLRYWKKGRARSLPLSRSGQRE